MSDLIDRITSYLASGGLYNPEFADPNAVRDLLIDCRIRIKHLESMAEDAVEDHDVRCAAESWWRWERQFTACIADCLPMLKHYQDVLKWICEGRCVDTSDPDAETGKPGLKDSEKAAAMLDGKVKP